MSENVKGTDAPKRGPGRPPRDPKWGAMSAAERSRKAYRRRQQELQEAAEVMQRLIFELDRQLSDRAETSFPEEHLATASAFIERYGRASHPTLSGWRKSVATLASKNRAWKKWLKVSKEQNRRRKSA